MENYKALLVKNKVKYCLIEFKELQDCNKVVKDLKVLIKWHLLERGDIFIYKMERIVNRLNVRNQTC